MGIIRHPGNHAASILVVKETPARSEGTASHPGATADAGNLASSVGEGRGLQVVLVRRLRAFVRSAPPCEAGKERLWHGPGARPESKDDTHRGAQQPWASHAGKIDPPASSEKHPEATPLQGEAGR